MPVSPTFVDQPPPPLQRGNSVVSLYQSCLNLLERLSGVPDFDQYLDPKLLQNTQAGSPTGSPNDPVNQLWVLFRMGSPLATIFNGLRPREPLSINNTDANLSNVNACKASVFHFLVACRTELQLSEDDLFTISQLYQDDTNGFVRVSSRHGYLIFFFYSCKPKVVVPIYSIRPSYACLFACGWSFVVHFEKVFFSLLHHWHPFDFHAFLGLFICLICLIPPSSFFLPSPSFLLVPPPVLPCAPKRARAFYFIHAMLYTCPAISQCPTSFSRPCCVTLAKKKQKQKDPQE